MPSSVSAVAAAGRCCCIMGDLDGCMGERGGEKEATDPFGDLVPYTFNCRSPVVNKNNHMSKY